MTVTLREAATSCERANPARTSEKCGSRMVKVKIHDDPTRTHAWCSRCGAKKEVPPQ